MSFFRHKNNSNDDDDSEKDDVDDDDNERKSIEWINICWNGILFDHVSSVQLNQNAHGV